MNGSYPGHIRRGYATGHSESSASPGVRLAGHRRETRVTSSSHTVTAARPLPDTAASATSPDTHHLAIGQPARTHVHRRHLDHVGVLAPSALDAHRMLGDHLNRRSQHRSMRARVRSLPTRPSSRQQRLTTGAHACTGRRTYLLPVVDGPLEQPTQVVRVGVGQLFIDGGTIV